MVKEKKNWGEQLYLFIAIIALLTVMGFAVTPFGCFLNQTINPICNFFYKNWWISAGCGIITIMSLIRLEVGK